ncbi:hypothetical protein [Paenibacillus sp. GXUN7292]
MQENTVKVRIVDGDLPMLRHLRNLRMEAVRSERLGIDIGASPDI